jgi:hypothetical protein
MKNREFKELKALFPSFFGFILQLSFSSFLPFSNSSVQKP